VLELDLWGRLAHVQALVVSPEGKIFVGDTGPLLVAGHTLAWARDRVLAQMAETFRGVHADLKLVRLRTFKVYCSGLVAKPGALEMTSASRASEAIALAGLADGASRRNIRIVHRDGTQGTLDLGLFEATGRQAFDPLLLDGDVLQVPRMTSFIEADGAVANAGRYELGPSDSLATLLGLAGGLLPSAAPERALLTRFRGASERESLWLQAGDLAVGSSALPLRDGDRLFVYFAADFHKSPTVEIYGEVQRPGVFPIVLGRDRLSDLVRWAGGFGPRANRSAMHLLRAASDGKENDPEFERLARLTRQDMTVSEYAAFQTRLAERKNSFRVDFAHVEKGGSDADPLLRDGDIVRVDELVMSVRVEGEVRRPGFVDFAPGRRVDDYVQLVGGYTNRASRGTVRVSRSLTGQVVPGRNAQSIEPGDFIWVPERKDVDAWLIFRDVVAVAGQIAVVVIAARK
jgi:protein involved in polysaccharide export with SLBB domain